MCMGIILGSERRFQSKNWIFLEIWPISRGCLSDHHDAFPHESWEICDIISPEIETTDSTSKFIIQT